MSTSLAAYADEYLELRRHLGAQLHDHQQLITSFIAFLERAGQETATVKAAVAWASTPVGTSHHWWAHRLGVIRGFCDYVHARDTDLAPLIPAGLIPSKSLPAIPYIYTPAQIVDLMLAARLLNPPQRGRTLATAIGLMASTGMRIGEALALNLKDVDLAATLITATGKYRKKRFVPIHPSTANALETYLRESRTTTTVHNPEAFFLTFLGTRPHRGNLEKAFRSLTTALGLLPRPGAGKPRLHDLRHTFSTNSLLDSYRSGENPDGRLAVLATYLGHVSPASTYWYLSATPELVGLVQERVEAAQSQGKLLP